MPDLAERPTAAQLRTNLCRTADFTLVRADGGDEPGDGLTIDGYGAVFNAATTIDSWEGCFDEVIAPGAFRKSIRENTPIMQFDHGRHSLIGSLPLGVWTTVEEDAQGLHVVGRLSDNWLVEPFRDAIRDGGVTGMSFRFSVVRDGWTDKDGKTIKDDELNQLLWYGAGDRGPILRTLKEVRVSEVGPVVWPAYDSTSVGVRSTGDPYIVDLGRLDLRSARSRSQLARAVALADAVAPPTETPGASEAPVAPPEPRSTEPADAHAPPAPPVTDTSAGEHSSANDERRNRMRAGISRVRGVMATINPKG